MNNNVIISLKNIGFGYDNIPVLDKINFEVKQGDFLGIIGPNGSGKTTLLKIILGLLPPTQGSVGLFGVSLSKFKNWSKIGYVPQKAGANTVNFPISVFEIVAMGRINNSRFLDFATRKDKEVIFKSLEEVEMLKSKNRLISELSGGQQQRVYIARALASRPELLILDEPTVGVDIESQSKFYDLLKKLNQKHKLTLILVSHDVNAVAHEVTEIACINRTMIAHGPPREILHEDFVEKLYGKELRYVLHNH